MASKQERIQWSPRVRPELIRQLYESDAAGLQDNDLCNEVGWRLYLRCQTIVMVARDEVACPRCGTVFVIDTATKGTISKCPGETCNWAITMLDYRLSWRKRYIWGANAMPAFENFYKRFSPALRYREKMLLIDRLIHQFHWSLKDNLPARSAANNLIEGNHNQVVEFLDNLTCNNPEEKEAWRVTKDRMMARRRGQLKKD